MDVTVHFITDSIWAQTIYMLSSIIKVIITIEWEKNVSGQVDAFQLLKTKKSYYYFIWYILFFYCTTCCASLLDSLLVQAARGSHIILTFL